MKKAFIYFSIIVAVVVIIYTVLSFLFIYEGSKVKKVVDVDFNTNVNLNTNQSQNMKYCVKAEDCQVVGCTCTCSGCGGFSYEDVVNKQYVNDWYSLHDCVAAKICPEVCCSPAEIVCEENTCKVKELSSEEE